MDLASAGDTGAYCGACAHAKEWDRCLDERIAEVSPRHVRAHVARALAALEATSPATRNSPGLGLQYR